MGDLTLVEPPVQFLNRPDGTRLAYRHLRGEGPTIVFLPGYMSDMQGGKAQALAAWAQTQNRPMLRLDYSGCGESDGEFQARERAVKKVDLHSIPRRIQIKIVHRKLE